jgi:tRNA threonylcarbamoyl adenosine modification protein YeaZ
MMKLFIDTTDNKKTVVGLDKKTWQVATKKHQSQQLLGLINKILHKKRNSINQITEIEVNLGPGSFTGLRVGVSVANALGWALKIPINGQRVGKLVEPKYE